MWLHKLKRVFYNVFVLILFFANLSAQAQGFRNEINLISDNDAYLAIAQDRYYTNGLFLSFRKAKQNPVATNGNKVLKKIWGISIGQKMFNPYSGFIPYKGAIDRPFAGYLFGSYNHQWLYKNESSLQVEIQMGTIGKYSLGEQGQKFIHKTFRFYEINGWKYQIHDNFGINVVTSYQHKIFRNKAQNIDLSMPLSIRLGNFFTGTNAALLFRWGKINKLNNSIATKSNLSYLNTNKTVNHEFFFYMKPAIDAVAYDSTISGSLMGSDKKEVTFDSTPLVLSNEVGFAFSKNRINLGFALLFKTKEIESTAKPHQYGSITLGYQFN
ncbi:lipid A deacylase LpxR family protein [Pseudopedobacter beijingensis]|uniref:Lipid A deacylase LpxR family protein n=1 Tax=Pseudopedobacter beijingensis TaxID=1207056 RepID=A0ABW4IDM1_9SPHI